MSTKLPPRVGYSAPAALPVPKRKAPAIPKPTRKTGAGRGNGVHLEMGTGFDAFDGEFERY